MREGFTFWRMVSFQVKPFETIGNRIIIIILIQLKQVLVIQHSISIKIFIMKVMELLLQVLTII